MKELLKIFKKVEFVEPNSTRVELQSSRLTFGLCPETNQAILLTKVKMSAVDYEEMCYPTKSHLYSAAMDKNMIKFN